jgi:prepilin-type N-terminal cleavage/methylation domain-containing protein
MPRGQDGFTLIETIVALALLSVITAICARGVSVGLRGVDTSEARDTVVRVARAKLASVGHSLPLTVGTYSGRDLALDVSWSVVITQYAEPTSTDLGRARAYWVRVTATRSATLINAQSTVELLSLKTAVSDGG